jgi:hypothetical protein
MFDAHMGLLVFLEDLLGCRVDVVTAKGLSLGLVRSSIGTSCASRDPLLYVADIVAADQAILRYIDGVWFDTFASNDEKRSAVECHRFPLCAKRATSAGLPSPRYPKCPEAG